MEFSPNNHIVKLCLQGMALEEKGEPEGACEVFLQAWSEASSSFEKFLAAYYVARRQDNTAERLNWLETALQWALKIDDSSIHSAFRPLYLSIAECYEDLGNAEEAKKNRDLAASFQDEPTDKGPFYHGTKADLQVGDLLTAGGSSNYKEGFKMNHIYFTALAHGAGLAAALAKGEGRERVYVVEPTGPFEDDPNVTNKKFPGNQTRSYRSETPLRIVGEVTDWTRLTPEELQRFREGLADSKGEIIN